MRSITLILGLALAACTTAPPEPVGRDLMTVSGRHGLPTASGSTIEHALWVSDVHFSEATSTEIGSAHENVVTSFQDGVQKSLRNHGYLAVGEDSADFFLLADLSSFESTRTTGGRQVHATVSFRSARLGETENEVMSCLVRDGTAEFEALTPRRMGDGRRTFAIVAGVAFAFAGVDASEIIANEFETAAQQTDAYNTHRNRSYGQGVAPSPGPQAMTRYAGVRAIQLAIADYVAAIHECGRDPNVGIVDTPDH